MKNTKKKKIFMGLGNVAGYFSNLKNGFDQIGEQSYHLNVDHHVYVLRETDSTNIYIRLLRYLYGTRSNKKLGKLKKISLALIYKMSLIPMFIWALLRFDIFIFGFNHSFFRLYDLPILKFFGKKIIFVYLGSDARPPYMNGAEIIYNKSSIDAILKKTANVKKKIDYVEKYSDYIINSPTIGQFHERDYINWFAIGMPTILASSKRGEDLTIDTSGRVNILHAASRPETKGSYYFNELIEKHKEKYNINYVFLTGVPNSVVIENLKKCDFVLDEIYSDSPMGGLGAEATAYGKPTLVSGYYSEKIYEHTPKRFIPPSVYCLPEKLEENLIKLCEDKVFRVQKGIELRNFIEKNWSSKSVAKKYMLIINDQVPSEWFFDWKSNDYIEGYGIDRVKIFEICKVIKNVYGKEKLFLSHNLKLTSALDEIN
jgi:glycosyltransferase involved in cell wall biosynthesis